MSYTVDSVKTDGFEMKYLKFGAGKKTLVILPGLSVQSVLPMAEAIENQYSLFYGGYTVYLFDRREVLPETYSVAEIADDTAKAIKALSLSDCRIFGASQGGMIAMRIAINYPELVGGLVLGSTACRVGDLRSSIIGKWISLAKEGNRKALYLAFGETVYPKETFLQYRDEFIKMAESVTDSDLKRFIILAEGTDGFDVSGELGKIRCPVLAVGDTEDTVLGADAIPEIAKYFNGNPNFEMYMYSGYGHAVYDTAPDFAQRMFEFFNKH